MEQKKEQYVQPEVMKHELLLDITAGQSGHVCELNHNNQCDE